MGEVFGEMHEGRGMALAESAEEWPVPVQAQDGSPFCYCHVPESLWAAVVADHSRSVSGRIDREEMSLVVGLVAALEVADRAPVVAEDAVGEEADVLEEEPVLDRLDLDSP